MTIDQGEIRQIIREVLQERQHQFGEEEAKQLFKEAIEEWVERKWAEGARWIVGAIFASLVAIIVGWAVTNWSRV